MFGLEKVVSKIIPKSELRPQYQSNLKSAQFAEPVDLLGLVSYQEDAVISRTLSNSKCGAITLFAFDQGQGLTEHTSPFDAFVQILEGSAEILVSGKRMQANEGQIVTLRSNQPHALNALSRFKMLQIMIRSE